MASYGTLFPNRSSTTTIAKKSTKLKDKISRNMSIALAEGNWIRALEVINAKYARPGLCPDHFQQLLRCILKHCPQHRGMVDYCRHMSYSDDIPNSPSLYATMVHCYTERGLLTDALETAMEGAKRWGGGATTAAGVHSASSSSTTLSSSSATMSAQTRNDMAMMILRKCADVRAYDVARRVVDESGLLLLSAKSNSRSGDEEVNKLLFRSMRMDRDWKDALSVLDQDVGGGGGAISIGDVSPDELLFLCAGAASAVPSSGQWTTALQLWGRAQQQQQQQQQQSAAALPAGNQQRCVHLLLNALAFAQRWQESIKVFNGSIRQGNGATASHATMALLYAQLFPKHWNVALDLFCRHHLPLLDPASGTPNEHNNNNNSNKRCEDVLENTEADDFRFLRELKEKHAAIVSLCSSLCSVSSLSSSAAAGGRGWEIALRVLETSIQPVEVGSLSGKATPVAHVVYQVAASSSDAFAHLSQRYPKLFPEQQQHGEQINKKMKKTEAAPQNVALFKPKSTSRDFSTVRPGTLHYFRKDRGSTVTPDAPAYLIHRRDKGKFDGDEKRPFSDPRLGPFDYTNEASGWSHYNKGGLTIFFNDKKLPSPLHDWPKYMRSIGNPTRGWSLSQNSVHAHQQSVRKWNKNKAL